MLRALAALVACVLMVVGPLSAAAQTAASSSTPPAETLDQLAARCMARVAQTDLRIIATPAVRDFRVTSAIFDHAMALAPDDATLLRLAIEAAENADDPDRVAAPEPCRCECQTEPGGVGDGSSPARGQG